MENSDYIIERYKRAILTKCTFLNLNQQEELSRGLKLTLESCLAEESGRIVLLSDDKAQQLKGPIDPKLLSLPHRGAFIRRLLNERGINTYEQLVLAVENDPYLFKSQRSFGRKSYMDLLADLREKGINLPAHREPLN